MKYILTPDHIDLFKSELIAAIFHAVAGAFLYFNGSFWFFKSHVEGFQFGISERTSFYNVGNSWLSLEAVV